MTLSIEKHNDNIFWFDLCPNDESAFISIYLVIDEKIAVIDTGPACSHDSLVRGIHAAGFNLQDIDYVIPTHIHLDHFGGGGHIMEVCENAKAIVHPKAYKHVSDIENWWEGSCEFLGDIANLYGKPKPITQSRLISAEKGFELSLGKLNIQALHTPGHAPHHITWICNKDAFVGDSAGLWYPNLEKSFPVTPGYYRHDLALESIEKMSLLDLEYLHYTHFGPRYSKGVLEITRSEFKIWMNIVEEGYSANFSAKDILEKLFDNRPGLVESDRNHGVHQRSTHLGTVEGMMDWLRREDAQG